MTPEDYVQMREFRRATVKRLSDGWMVTCPAHEDANPSLHVSPGRDGAVLLKCQAGCPTDDVLAADGLEWPDLFLDGASTNGKVEVAAYTYEDEDGRALFEVVRFRPKGFAMRLPDGTWKVGGVRRVLYRLPRVIAAVQVGDPVYVVEGEKDVHTGERAGAVATCNPNGAGKWRQEYGASLRDATVIVIRDGDKAGREHANTVARSLTGVARAVTVVDTKAGKDVTEHLAAGHTLGDLAPIPAPEPEPSRPGPAARYPSVSGAHASRRVPWAAR